MTQPPGGLLNNQGVLGGPLPLVNNGMLPNNFLGPNGMVNSGLLSTSATTSTVTPISSSVPPLVTAPQMLMPPGLIMNNGQVLMPPQQMVMGQDMLLGNQAVMQGQSGNVISMNTVPSQPNQLPSALVLPNGQIVPVVSQPGMMPIQTGALGGGLLMPTGPPTTTPNPALPVLNIPRLPMPTAPLTNTSQANRLPLLTGIDSKPLRPLLSLSDTNLSTTAPKLAGGSLSASRPLLSGNTDRSSPVIANQGLVTTTTTTGSKAGPVNSTGMPNLPTNGTVIMSADGTILFTLPPGANPGNLMLDPSGLPLPTPPTSQASIGKPKKPGQRVLMPKPTGGLAGFPAFGDASGAFVMSPLDPQLAKFATLSTVAPTTDATDVTTTRSTASKPAPASSASTTTTSISMSQTTTSATTTNTTSAAESSSEPAPSQAGPTDILAQAAESIFASSEMSPTLSSFYNPAHEDNPLQIDTSLAEGEDSDIKKERQTPQTVAAPSAAGDVTKLGTQDSLKSPSRPAAVNLSTAVCLQSSSVMTSSILSMPMSLTATSLPASLASTSDSLPLPTLLPGMLPLAQTAGSLPAPIMSTGLAPSQPQSTSASVAGSLPASSLLSMPLLTTTTVNTSSGGSMVKHPTTSVTTTSSTAQSTAASLVIPQPQSISSSAAVAMLPPPPMLVLGSTTASSTVTTVTAAQPGMGTVAGVPMKALPQGGAASVASSTFPQPLTTTSMATNVVTQIETPDSTSEKTKHHKKKKKSRSRSRSRKHGEKEGEEGKSADGSSEKSKEKSKEKKDKSKKNKKKSKKSKSSSKDPPVKVISATDGGIVAEKIEFMPKEISVMPKEISVMPKEISVMPKEISVMPKEISVNQVIQLESKAPKKTKSSDPAEGEPVCKKPRQTALEQELHSAMQGLSPLSIELMDDSDTIKLPIPEVQASDLNESIVTFMHSDSKEAQALASPSSSLSPAILTNTWKRVSPGKLNTPKMPDRKKVEELRVEVTSRKESVDLYSPVQKKKEPATISLSPVKTSSQPVTTTSSPTGYTALSKASLSLTSSSTQTKHVPVTKKTSPVASAPKTEPTSTATTTTPSYTAPTPATRPSSMPLVEVSTPSLPSPESLESLSLESLAPSTTPIISAGLLLTEPDKTLKLSQPKESPTLEALDFTSIVPMTPPPPVVPKSTSSELNPARHSNIAHLARGLTPSKHGSPVPTKAAAYKQHMLGSSGTTTASSTGNTATYSSSTVTSAGNIVTYTNLNTPQPAEKPSKCDMADSPPPKPICIETTSTKKLSTSSASVTSSSSPTSCASSLFSHSASILPLHEITLSPSLTVATTTVPYQITSKSSVSTSLGNLTPGGSSIDEGYNTSPGSISSMPGSHSPYSLSYKPDLPSTGKSSSMPTPWPVPGPQPAALMSPSHHSPPAKSQLAKASMAPPSSQPVVHKSDSSCSQGRSLSLSNTPPSTLASSNLSPNLLTPTKPNTMTMGANNIPSVGKTMHSSSSSSGMAANNSSSSGIKLSGSSPSAGMNVPGNNSSSPLNISGTSSSGMSNLSGSHNSSSNLNLGSGSAPCGAMTMPGNTPPSSMGMSRTNTPSTGMNNNMSGATTAGILNIPGSTGQSGNLNMSRTNTPSGVNMTGSNSSSCSMNLSGSNVPSVTMNIPGNNNNMGMNMSGANSMSTGMNMQMGNTQSGMNNRSGNNTPGANLSSTGNNLPSGGMNMSGGVTSASGLNMPSGVMNMNNSTSPASMNMPSSAMNMNNTPSGNMNVNNPPSGGMNVNNTPSGGMNVNNPHSGGMTMQGNNSMNMNSSSGGTMKLSSSSSPAGGMNPPSCNKTTTSPQQSHSLSSSGASRPPVPALSSCAMADSAVRTCVASTTVPVSTVSTSPVTSVRTTSSSALSVTSSTVAGSSSTLTATKASEPACSFSTQSDPTPTPVREKTTTDAPPAKKRSRKKASPEGGRSKAKSRASGSASSMASSCSLTDMQSQPFPLMNPWQSCASPPPRGFLSGFGLPQSASPGFSFTLSSTSCAPSTGSMAHANSGPASVYSAAHPQQFFPYPHLPPGSRPQYRPQGHQPSHLSLSHFNLPPHAAHNQLSPRGGQTQGSRNTQKQTPPQSGLNNQASMAGGGRMDTQSRSPRAPPSAGFLGDMGGQTGYGDTSLGLEDRSKCTRPLSHSPMMPAAGSQSNRHAPSPRTPQLAGNMTPFYSGMPFSNPPEVSNQQSAQMLSPRYPGPGSGSNSQQQRRPFDTPQLTPHFSAAGYEPPSIQFSQASETPSQTQMAPFRQAQPPKQTPPSAEDTRPKSASKASSSKSQRSKSSKKKPGYEVDTNLSNSIFDSGGGRSMTPVYQPLSSMSPPPSQRASVQPDAPTYLPSNLFAQPGRPLSNTTPLQHKGDMSTPFNPLFSGGRPQNGLGLQFQPGFGMGTPGHGQVPPSQQLPSHSSSMANFNFSQIFPDITSSGQNEALNMSPIKFGAGGALLPPQAVMDHPSIPHPGSQGSGMYSQRPHMLHNAMSINSLLAHNHGFEGRSMAPSLNATPFPPHAHAPSFGMHPPLNFQLHDH